MKKVVLSIAFVAAVLVSCNKKGTEGEVSADSVPALTDSVPAATNDSVPASTDTTTATETPAGEDTAAK
jgi:hypothetical protein